MKKVNKSWKKLNGTIMFPSTHDLTPLNVDECITCLKNMLVAGNRVLVVSKPHLDVIKRLCEELEPYKAQILFRFTIGSVSDETLGFWEPNAPRFQERLDSLRYAFERGFNTSVSSEPCLDRNVNKLVERLLPWVSNALWIGPTNKMETRVCFRDIPHKDAKKDPTKWTDTEWKMWNEAKAFQEIPFLQSLYDRYKDNKKIKWKNRIKELLHLKLPDDIGLDV
jgi:DNA repair photolyase